MSLAEILPSQGLCQKSQRAQMKEEKPKVKKMGITNSDLGTKLFS